MNELGLYQNIISGQTGAWAAPLRGLLGASERLYAAAVRVRNSRFDRSPTIWTAPVPVISVGNITTGGTGKTPFVVDVVQRLDRLGLSPAVLARGYGSPLGEPNDEELLIRKHCPGASYIADGDRVRAAKIAAAHTGANVIVLDDGFQHRRLARDLDIVLIDANCPFGYDRLLPRGLLREPVSGLRRAHLFVITRCDQASSALLGRVEDRLRAVAPDVPILHAFHRVIALERLDGTPIDMGPVRTAALFAAIARPGSFATTVASLGIEVVGVRWWPDHHQYREREVASLLSAARLASCDLLLTTEKDAVKLAGIAGLDKERIGVVRVAIAYLKEGDRILESSILRVLGRRGLKGAESVS